MNYRAICKFQVYDRPSGPRWLESGDLVPTGYMGRRLIADFLRMGYMELVEEDVEAAKALEFLTGSSVDEPLGSLGYVPEEVEEVEDEFEVLPESVEED